MGIAKVFAVILIVIGAVIALFVRGLIKWQLKKIDRDEDGDFAELLSMSASVFILIGMAVTAAGTILYFIN